MEHSYSIFTLIIIWLIYLPIPFIFFFALLHPSLINPTFYVLLITFLYHPIFISLHPIAFSHLLISSSLQVSFILLLFFFILLLIFFFRLAFIFLFDLIPPFAFYRLLPFSSFLFPPHLAFVFLLLFFCHLLFFFCLLLLSLF